MDSSSSNKDTEITDHPDKETKQAKQSKNPAKILRDKLRMISFRRKKAESAKTNEAGKSRNESPIAFRRFTYENTELSMKLARLEEPKILITALRHIVRKTHPNGNRVTFPVPEAVDRLQLKCNCLPTNETELLDLLKQVYKRRDESLDIDEVYKDFVMTHGRITIDYTQKWPNSHLHTRHP